MALHCLLCLLHNNVQYQDGCALQEASRGRHGRRHEEVISLLSSFAATGLVGLKSQHGHWADWLSTCRKGRFNVKGHTQVDTTEPQNKKKKKTTQVSAFIYAAHIFPPSFNLSPGLPLCP